MVNKIIKNINVICVLILCGAALLGCSLFAEKTPATWQPDILWELEGFDYIGSPPSRLDYKNNLLLLPGFDTSGLNCVDISKGTLNWNNSDYGFFDTQPVIWNNYVIITSDSNADANIIFYNKETGEIAGKYAVTQMKDTTKINFDYWAKVVNNIFYFTIHSYDKSIAKTGVYSINLSALTFNSEESIDIEPDLFAGAGDYQRCFTAPVFDEDTVYVYKDGAGVLVEDGTELEQGEYYQSHVELTAYNYEGEIQWTTGFDYCGSASLGAHQMQSYGDYLFIADWSGMALVRKEDGEILYEKPGMWCGGFFTIEGDYAYTTVYFSLYRIHIPSGNIEWSDMINFTRDSKPVVYKDKLYVVDSDALRCYNKKNGELLGVNEDLGVPGYRVQWYIPYIGNTLYIPQMEKIVAIRME